MQIFDLGLYKSTPARVALPLSIGVSFHAVMERGAGGEAFFTTNLATLVKGSRAVGMERIVRLLQAQA